VYKYGNALICVLTLLAKKKVTVMSSTEVFPMAGLALQVDVSTSSVMANIPGLMVVEECWNFSLEAANIQLEAVTLKAVRL
jgi:hypothetical protein